MVLDSINLGSKTVSDSIRSSKFTDKETDNFFRIFVLGYYGISELNHGGKTPFTIYLISILYIFGLIWFGAMVKQNCK